MTREELEATFEKFDKEHGKFNRAKSPPSKRPDLCAFLLLDRLVPGNRDIIGDARHDQFFLSIDLDELAAVATESDILTLVRCGVMIDEDGLAMFA